MNAQQFVYLCLLLYFIIKKPRNNDFTVKPQHYDNLCCTNCLSPLEFEFIKYSIHGLQDKNQCC